MDRRGDLRLLIFLAAAAAAMLAWAPATRAAEPATLEYNVEIPSAANSQPRSTGVRPATLDQAGVAGESTSGVESPLGSALGTVLSAPMALALVAALGVCGWLALGAAGRRPGTR